MPIHNIWNIVKILSDNKVFVWFWQDSGIYTYSYFCLFLVYGSWSSVKNRVASLYLVNLTVAGLLRLMSFYWKDSLTTSTLTRYTRRVIHDHQTRVEPYTCSTIEMSMIETGRSVTAHVWSTKQQPMLKEWLNFSNQTCALRVWKQVRHA